MEWSIYLNFATRHGLTDFVISKLDDLDIKSDQPLDEMLSFAVQGDRLDPRLVKDLVRRGANPQWVSPGSQNLHWSGFGSRPKATGGWWNLTKNPLATSEDLVKQGKWRQAVEVFLLHIKTKQEVLAVDKILGSGSELIWLRSRLREKRDEHS